jgi:hypothetical protein
MPSEDDYERLCEILSKAFDFDKALKIYDIAESDVDELRKMALSCDDIPKVLHDKILLIFLIAWGNTDMNESLNLLQRFCKQKREAHEFFTNRDFYSKEIQLALDNQIYLTLPPMLSSLPPLRPPVANNFNIVFHKLANNDPKSYDFVNSQKVLLMTVGKWLIINSIYY